MANSVMKKIISVTEKKNIPVDVMFELTHRCNLRCVQCYNPEKKLKEKELSTNEVKDILDQLADAGSLFLVFTGGEVFMRKDILGLADYARKKGFDLSVFTNGTLVTDYIAGKLSEISITTVDISIYGATDITHDKITQVPGSFRKSIEGVEILRKNNIDVTLKCLLMKQNFHEYPEFARLSRSIGVRHKLDYSVVPRNDGNKAPLEYRLDEENLKKFLTDNFPFDFVKRRKNYKPKHFCSAGKNICSISPYGDVYPCLQLMIKAGNLREHNFNEIWYSIQKSNVLNKLRSMKPDDLSVCNTCSILPYCGRCPGIAHLEDGNIKGPSKFACQTAGIIADMALGASRPPRRTAPDYGD
ncbi:MAG: radical SAM protein [Elusimicrobia bacterium]|nr:radical SAM protein [Elusimicrobiota bacterium]